MDDEAKKNLDNYVKDIQTNIIALRTVALGPTEMQKQEMTTYIHAINLLNKCFETNYLDHGFMALELTDSNNVVLKGLMKKLPFKK